MLLFLDGVMMTPDTPHDTFIQHLKDGTIIIGEKRVEKRRVKVQNATNTFHSQVILQNSLKENMLLLFEHFYYI
jgi:hypothetical protein